MMKHLLVFLVLSLCSGVIFAQYKAPDLSQPLLDKDALRYSDVDCGKVSKLISLMVEAEKQPISTLRMKEIRKLMGLAMHLNPDGREAMLMNTRLLKGQRWKAPGRVPQPREAAEYLSKIAGTCEKTANAEDIKLAGYLYAAADMVDKSFFAAASSLREFEGKRGKIDWEFLNGKRVAGGGKGSLFANGKNERIEITKEPSDGYDQKNREWQRRQVSLSAMMVKTIGSGRMVGTSMDSIMTISPTTSSRSSLKFARPVGPQMSTALSEAKRLAQFRYPFWSSGDVTISFADKYTPKDGGSAGTLFTLQFLALLDGLEYEDNLAVTGDITVDWKVRKVGGVAEKLRGAVIGGCDKAIIPKTNEEAVLELVLVHSPKTLAEIQIFACDTILEAVEVARLDKQASLAAAMALYESDVGAPVRAKGGAALRDPKVLAALKKVVAAAPQHLSAKYLLMGAEGTLPKTLSISPSLRQIFMAASGLIGEGFAEGESSGVEEDLTLDDAVTVMTKLKGITPIVHSELKPLHAAMYGLSLSTCNYKKAIEIRNAAAEKKYEKEIEANSEKVLRALKKMGEHQSILEELMNP